MTTVIDLDKLIGLDTLWGVVLHGNKLIASASRKVLLKLHFVLAAAEAEGSLCGELAGDGAHKGGGSHDRLLESIFSKLQQVEPLVCLVGHCVCALIGVVLVCCCMLG